MYIGKTVNYRYQARYVSMNKKVNIGFFFFFSFKLYPAHSRVGR